ncbi:hypothetical protein BEWA_034450 [Theileria equi strain WA]|uniref:Uncharacterized protein n=1 Tax=Theileria equi strain WA TaxID=1537102 RepID=L0AYC1_THEEQ|nr:hypothetical protein BEWA_034450 [Theileria equi strain WA]AFZ80587.1 hypothetical protein BEWA_034450 [Theileria equi strain WA]|eukprot:XP_004830253.1 hypothetical protein BEWA_034450 [Theileria equi strain WA]
MSKNSRRCLHGISKLLTYRKPGIVYNSIEKAKEIDSSNVFSPPYFIKDIPQCSDTIFESVPLGLCSKDIPKVHRFLSESRISISIRKAKL